MVLRRSSRGRALISKRACKKIQYPVLCSITYLLTQATPPWRVRASCWSWLRGTRWVKRFLKKIKLLHDDLKLFIIVFIYLLADSSVQFRRGHLWRPQGFAQLLPLCRSAGKRYDGKKVAKANHFFFLSHTALLQRPAMNSNNRIDIFYYSKFANNQG